MSKDITEKTITIQGLSFTVSTPYAEGHVVNEAEAKALNQTRAEAIRNNTARVVKTALDEAGKTTDADGKEVYNDLSADVMSGLEAEIAEYDASYVFTLASVGGGRKSTDPVETEALRIARAAITAKLKASGRKVKDVDKDALDAAIAKLADTDNVRKAAAKNVKAAQDMAATAIESFDL